MTREPKWGFWVFITVLVVLHFVVRIGLGWEQLAPDLLVVALLLAARELRAGAAAGLGFLLGILDGSIVPFALGSSALVLAILGFLGSRTREFLSGDNLLTLAVYLFAGKWAFDAMLYVVTGAVFDRGGSYLILISPLTALYAAAAGLVATAVYRIFA